MTIYILLFIVTLIISAYLSAVHIAFMSQNEYSILTISGNDQSRIALLKNLYRQRENILISLVSLNMIVNIFATILCTIIICDYLMKTPEDGLMDAVISIIVSITIILPFGEIMPSIIGNAKSNSICYSSSNFLNLMSKISKPFIGLVSNIKNIILKLIKKETLNLNHPTTIEEIKLIGVHGREAGLIEDFGYKMITKAHYFNTLETSDLMIPMSNVITLNVNDGLETILSVFSKNMYSRIPVFNDNNSDIIGVFNYKEICLNKFSVENFSLKNHLQTPLFVPDSILISRLFEKMRNEKSQLAIVQNEYGSIVGIVSMSDIIERIFGKIDDEYEDSKQSRLIEKTKSINEATVEGSVSLSDLSNILKINFDSKSLSDFNTLNGFLVNLKGGFLAVNDEFIYKNYSFTVTSMKNQFAEKIFIKELDN